MEKFGHFFEFIAAINSIYIVSDAFMEALLHKINSEFVMISKSLEGIKDNQVNNLQKFRGEVQKVHHNQGTENIEREYSEKARNIESAINKLGSDISEAFQDKEMFRNFNFWCLYGCLYCIGILLLNGFEVSFKTDNYFNDSFLLFNILSPLILLWLIRPKKKKLLEKYCTVSYNKIIHGFIVLVIIIFSICYWTRFTYDLGGTVKIINILLALMLPTIHFTYYLCRSTLFSISKSIKFKQDLVNVEKSIIEFGKDIEVAYKVIADIVKHLPSQSDIQLRKPKNINLINIFEPHELNWWAAELGVSRGRLMAAVRRVGPITNDVKDYFGK